MVLYNIGFLCYLGWSMREGKAVTQNRSINPQEIRFTFVTNTSTFQIWLEDLCSYLFGFGFWLFLERI